MEDSAAGDPPRPPDSGPPTTPTIEPAPAIVATGRALTLANWIKAVLLGIGLHFVVLVGLLVLGQGPGPAWLVAWLTGALLGCYAFGLRSIKPYLAVAGGMLIPILAFDLIVLAYVFLHAFEDHIGLSAGSVALVATWFSTLRW